MFCIKVSFLAVLCWFFNVLQFPRSFSKKGLLPKHWIKIEFSSFLDFYFGGHICG